MKDIVTQSGSVTLEVTDELTDDVLEMLEGTLWGTEGGLRYHHLETKENLEKTPNVYFLNLRRNDSLLSSITLCHKATMKDGQPVEVYHIRYFAFLNTLQSAKRENPKKAKKKTFLDNQLIHFFENYRMPESVKNDTPQIFHAQVEADNMRSKLFTEKVGFKTIGHMTTLTFSRIFPKKSNAVTSIAQEEQEGVLQHIKDFYNDFVFFSTENLFKDENCFVLKENGEPVVGGHAYIGNWEFKDVPGVEGIIAKYLLPYMPLVRRIFNVKHHTFVVVEGLFWKKGYEHKVQEFLSSVLKDMNKNVAFLWMDVETDQYKEIKNKVDWGVLEYLNSGAGSSVIIRSVREEDYEAFGQKPKYIPSFNIL